MKHKNMTMLLLGALALGLSTASSAASQATATLSNFIQSGTITNNAASTANLTGVIYSLGTAGDGIATWDTAGSGTASDFLSNNNWFQTVSWTGLNIGAGSSFNFSGLDIDLITTLSPLSVTGTVLDNSGSSLVNATLSLLWSDGSTGVANLAQQAWSTTQNLTISSVSAVPVPAALFMFAPALLGFIGLRRKAKI